jgi:hypothetical protein
MNEQIVSKDLIREQAQAAAARWAMHPGQDKPQNPYSEVTCPEAHALWHREFSRALLQHSAPQSGQGA